METFIKLYLVLLLLYLIDCLYWTDGSKIVFVSYRLSRCALATPLKLGAFIDKYAILLNPLPLFGSIFTGGTTRAIYTVRGVYIQAVFLKHTPSTNVIRSFIDYESIASCVADNRSVYINDELFCEFAAESLALHAVECISRLRADNITLRVSTINDMIKKNAFDDETAIRLANLLGELTPIRALCVIEFALFAAALPLAIVLTGVSNTTITNIVAIYLLGLYISILCYIMRARWSPVGKFKMFMESCEMFLFPLSAIRVCDRVTTPAFLDADILSLAGQLLPRDRFLKSLSIYRRSLLSIPQGLLDADEHLNRLLMQEIRYYTQRAKASELDIQTRPLEREDGALSYCPCCFAQYTNDLSTCPECFDISLRKWEGS